MNRFSTFYKYIFLALMGAGGLVFSSLFLSCDSQRVYDHFAHTPLQGWEKNDSLRFDVPPLKQPGAYTMTLSLRHNESYPFTSISLIVDQRIFPGKRGRTDTIKCELFQKASPGGNGVSTIQHEYPLHRLVLSKGDSLHISVRHNMKREILPGISDVGIRLRLQN